MARGWESKSVESQQSETEAGTGRRRLTIEEREKTARRETLEIQRSRVARELDGARSDVHRTALQNALTYLDGELSKLG